MAEILNLNDFSGCSDMERIEKALEKAREMPGSTLVIPPGDYLLTTDRAVETMHHAVEGIYGENPEDTMFRAEYAFSTGIRLFGHDGTTIRAYGARFHVLGFMQVMSMEHCRHTSVEGLTIDYVRKPYSRGCITEYAVTDPEAHAGYMEVEFAPEFPVTEHTVMPRYCVYDFRNSRFNLQMKMQSREYLGGQRYRFSMTRMPDRTMAGEEFYVWHSFHFRPAILIEHSGGIRLQDVTIHSQPGMGVVGHRSRDITLRRLRVIPAPDEHMSTNTDATHFTSCRGKLIFDRCEFEGHGDDATNVHTFYHNIRPDGPRSYVGSVDVRTHSLTPDYPDEGDEMELVDKRSLKKLAVYHVLKSELHPEDGTYTAELDGELPPDASERCWLSDVSQIPEVLFTRCTAKNHWARSVLLKTRHVEVSHCVFIGSAMQAIHIAPEAWWREGVACSDILISHNRFYLCGLSGHPDTAGRLPEAGGVKIEMSAEAPEGCGQQDIRIENNLFMLPGVQYAVSIKNARNVTLRDNRYIGCEAPVFLRDCEEVRT